MPYEQDDPRDFLRRIVWTLSLGLVWLVATIGIGTYAGLMVPEKKLTIGNIIFYGWMLISLAGLIWVNYRIWKKKFPHG
jgi:FtsH-binding integral membrane protein